MLTVTTQEREEYDAAAATVMLSAPRPLGPSQIVWLIGETDRPLPAGAEIWTCTRCLRAVAFCAPTLTVVLEAGAIVTFWRDRNPTTGRRPEVFDGGASAAAEPQEVGVVLIVQSNEAPRASVL